MSIEVYLQYQSSRYCDFSTGVPFLKQLCEDQLCHYGLFRVMLPESHEDILRDSDIIFGLIKS